VLEFVGRLGVFVMIEVVLIGDKESKRCQPLQILFRGDTRFNVSIIKPVFLKSMDDSLLKFLAYDVEKSKAFNMRELSLGEIGCAIAHNNARELLAKNGVGGLVLEDDARIPSLDYLHKIAIHFLSSTKSPSLLNCSVNLKLDQMKDSSGFDPVFQKRLTPSPLTVGYMVNHSGAEMLNKANSSINWVADWPYSKVVYYRLQIPAIAHGDNDSGSLIDPLGNLNRSGNRLKRRFLLFSFTHFLRNRMHFKSLKFYVVSMLLPRIFHSLNL
jgi:GR25 family glycosyltransferase involved in LPS biosynthesis